MAAPTHEKEEVEDNAPGVVPVVGVDRDKRIAKATAAAQAKVDVAAPKWYAKKM